MKKEDLYSFKRGLDATVFEYPTNSYAVTITKQELRKAISKMEEFIKPSEAMVEFFKSREALAKKFSFKNEDGSPKTKKKFAIDGSIEAIIYVIEGEGEKDSQYTKQITKLRAKHKTEIEKHDLKVKVYNEEFLKEESDFKPMMIKMADLNKHEKCSVPVMDLIFWMIQK